MSKIAIIVSQYNKEITDKLLQGTLKQLKTENISESCIKLVYVPGAFEIPLTASCLAEQNQYSAIICLAAVIRGDTDHYDYVCEQVSQGCMQVMLNFKLPVIFGVLTTHNIEQAYARVGGVHGHKGIEAAQTTMHMIKTIASVRAEDPS